MKNGCETTPSTSNFEQRKPHCNFTGTTGVVSPQTDTTEDWKGPPGSAVPGSPEPHPAGPGAPRGPWSLTRAIGDAAAGESGPRGGGSAGQRQTDTTSGPRTADENK